MVIVNASPLPLGYNVQFWTARMLDHAELYRLGVKVSSQKIDEICQTWKNYNKKLSNIDTENISAEELVNQLDGLERFNKILEETIQLNRGILDRTKTEWTGWIYPSMIEHILEETCYFKQIIFGPYDPEEQLKYILKHNRTETAAIVQYLDPENLGKKVHQNLQTWIFLKDPKYSSLEEGRPTAELLHQYGVQLAEYLGSISRQMDSRDIKNVLTPYFIDQHAALEVRYFDEVLQKSYLKK